MNQLTKTEIEIEEPIIQLQEASNAQSNSLKRGKYSPTNGKKKKTKQKPAKPQAAFKCEFCPERYSTNLSLIEHTRKLHSDKLPFECRVCRKRFTTTSQMKEHESNCQYRRFECHICKFSSLHADWNRFLVHFRKHTGEMPFSCKCCAKQFSSKRMLNHHMKYHPSEIPRKCSFCQRCFVNSAEAKKHEAHCSLKRQMECYLCKSAFTFRSSLRRHMPQHTGSTKFNCAYCNKGYVRKEFLHAHLQKIHAKELQSQCTICEMRFVQQSDADKHMQICKKKKELKCNLCSYKTISAIYFEDHKQKHVGSDEFKCLHCDEVFLQRSKLVHHVKIHNKKSKFNCPYCQKKYDRWLFMERHSLICPCAPNNSISRIS